MMTVYRNHFFFQAKKELAESLSETAGRPMGADLGADICRNVLSPGAKRKSTTSGSGQ